MRNQKHYHDVFNESFIQPLEKIKSKIKNPTSDQITTCQQYSKVCGDGCVTIHTAIRQLVESIYNY